MTAKQMWLWRFLWGALAVLAVTLSVVALVPEWRVSLHGRLFPEDKKLLATVTGDLLGDGSHWMVLKFSTSRGIIIEVHADKLIDRLFIPDRHDGYFSINNQASRLALVDIDNDGRPEIIAPSFDEKLVAHLNTLRLDPDTKRLELVRGPQKEQQ